MLQRSAFAALVAVVVTTAGCAGLSPGTPTSPESPETPTPPAPPSGTVDFSDGPKEPPDRPPVLNESAVHGFVREYEYRYAYNSLWVNQSSNVTLACRVDGVSEQPWGYQAVVTCSGSSETDGLHGDWFTQTYRYRVSETALNRTQIQPRDPVS